MDADISDILASVSAPSTATPTLDLQALTRAWVNERSAPELLPYPSALVERMTGRIKHQIDTIEHMTGTMDPKANFALVVLQTELERIKFIVRSFLRARIAKIDKTPLHYRALTAAAAPYLSNPILSPLEDEYVQNHLALWRAHYDASFLAALPANLQNLEDQSGGISMVDKPEADAAVFGRVLRDVEEPVVVHGEEETVEVTLKRGDVWVLRWKDVREGVERGDIELI